MVKKNISYYAVAVGAKPGIYRTWAEAEKNVYKFSGAVFKGFSTLDAAESFVAKYSAGAEGVSPVLGKRTSRGEDDVCCAAPPVKRQNPGGSYYAVARGFVPGIYRTWAETERQVNKFENAKHQKFATVQEAEAFIEKNSVALTRVNTHSPEFAPPLANRVREDKGVAGEHVSNIYLDGQHLKPHVGGVGGPILDFSAIEGTKSPVSTASVQEAKACVSYPLHKVTPPPFKGIRDSGHGDKGCGAVAGGCVGILYHDGTSLQPNVNGASGVHLDKRSVIQGPQLTVGDQNYVNSYSPVVTPPRMINVRENGQGKGCWAVMGRYIDRICHTREELKAYMHENPGATPQWCHTIEQADAVLEAYAINVATSPVVQKRPAFIDNHAKKTTPSPVISVTGTPPTFIDPRVNKDALSPVIDRPVFIKAHASIATPPPGIDKRPASVNAQAAHAASPPVTGQRPAFVHAHANKATSHVIGKPPTSMDARKVVVAQVPVIDQRPAIVHAHANKAASSVIEKSPARIDAQTAEVATSPVLGKRKSRDDEEAYYAVHRGRVPGIYRTYNEAEAQIKGLYCATYRKFTTRDEAERWLQHRREMTVRQPRDPDPKEKSTLVAFTDGSAMDNGTRNCRTAFATIFPHNMKWNIAKEIEEPYQTNNRAEYWAAVEALRRANKEDAKQSRTMYIYTDSMLLISTMTEGWIDKWKANGWKKADGGRVRNPDLVELLDACRGKRHVIWIHVKAHTRRQNWESIWNDVADKKAKEARRANQPESSKEVNNGAGNQVAEKGTISVVSEKLTIRKLAEQINKRQATGNLENGCNKTRAGSHSKGNSGLRTKIITKFGYNRRARA